MQQLWEAPSREPSTAARSLFVSYWSFKSSLIMQRSSNIMPEKICPLKDLPTWFAWMDLRRLIKASM